MNRTDVDSVVNACDAGREGTANISIGLRPVQMQKTGTEFRLRDPITPITTLPANIQITDPVALIDLTSSPNQVNSTITIANNVETIVFKGRDTVYEGLSMILFVHGLQLVWRLRHETKR